MSRPDQAITYLKDHGYCVLRMPRSDALPGQTLLRTGKKDLVRLGELGSVMKAGANPLPIPSLDNVAGNVSGVESSTIKLEIGLTILGDIISAFGGGKLGAKTGYERAKTVTFKYEDVTEDHIALDRLDQFLSTAEARRDSRAVLDGLIDDKVFVITSTIKSRKLTVTAKTDGTTSAGIEVPVVQQVASGTLDVKVTRAAEGVVNYEGKTPLVFGFQAVQLFFNEAGQYASWDPLDAGAAAARAVGRVKPVYLLEPALFRLEPAPAEPVVV
jgi:hypothetical protein